MECRHSKELKFRTKESFYKPERIDWTPLKESVDFFKRHFAWLKQNDSFKGINSVFFFSLVTEKILTECLSILSQCTVTPLFCPSFFTLPGVPRLLERSQKVNLNVILTSNWDHNDSSVKRHFSWAKMILQVKGWNYLLVLKRLFWIYSVKLLAG